MSCWPPHNFSLRNWIAAFINKFNQFVHSSFISQINFIYFFTHKPLSAGMKPFNGVVVVVCLSFGGAPAAGSGHNPPKEQTTQLHFHSFIPLGPPARQFSFSSSARPLGRASWKRERNWMSEGSHQSVHLPQIQIKLTHRFVFVYNSWLAAYTVIILLFHFISFL